MHLYLSIAEATKFQKFTTPLKVYSKMSFICRVVSSQEAVWSNSIHIFSPRSELQAAIFLIN